MTKEIKKYRRKVSDERVERAAEALYLAHNMQGKTRKSLKEWEASRDRGSTSFLWEARIVLEADANVIEGHLEFSKFYHSWVFLTKRGNSGTLETFYSEEHFASIWEEIL